MRLLLFILLLLANNLYSQVTIAGKVTAGPVSTNATSYTTATADFTAGRMYILLVMVTGATNEGSVTASSQTWTLSGSAGDATRRIQAFTTIASTTVVEATTFGDFGSTGTGFIMSIFEVTGMSTSGTVKQVAYGGATGSNPSITMAGLANNSAVFTGWFSDTNPFSGTAEAGWTEHSDGGYTVPTTGTYIMYRGSTSDNTPTVTAASSTWIGLAIEIAANKRRIFGGQ